MCDICFKDLIYRFDSKKEFENFGTKIQNKCLNGKIVVIKREETDFWAPFDSDEFYKCNSCGQIWVLSIAQDARGGFFLTQEKGIEYVNKLHQKNKLKRIGCLVVVVCVGLLTLWKLST